MNKFSAERAIKARRERAYELETAQARAADFYAAANVATRQDAKWGSDATFERSMRNYQRQYEREVAETERREALSTRRDKLAAMLQNEGDEFTRELTARVPTKADRMKTMRERADKIKTARETKRAAATDKSRRSLVRSEHPDVRTARAEAERRHIEAVRAEQLKVDQTARAAEARHVAAFEAQMEANRQKEVDAARAAEKASKERARSVAKSQRDQVDELAARDAEADRLRRHAAAVDAELERFVEEKERRELHEARLRQLRYGRQLQRQHRAALQRRSQQTQDDLEHDLTLLRELEAAHAAEGDAKTERRLKAIEDVQWMRQETEAQLQLEREREREFEDMYREEARRMYAKQEAEWDRERAARDRLMQQVLDERQGQLEEKAAKIRQTQQESLAAREELLAAIDRETHRGARDRATRRAEITSRRHELDSQIDRRAEMEAEERARARAVERARQRREAELQRIADEEVAALRDVYTPPRFGRRRVAWD